MEKIDESFVWLVVSNSFYFLKFLKLLNLNFFHHFEVTSSNTLSFWDVLSVENNLKVKKIYFTSLDSFFR